MIQYFLRPDRLIEFPEYFSLFPFSLNSPDSLDFQDSGSFVLQPCAVHKTSADMSMSIFVTFVSIKHF